MSDPILRGQLQDTDKDRREICWHVCRWMATEWGGHAIPADVSVGWTRADDGESAVSGGTDIEEAVETCVALGVPHQVVIGRTGDLCLQAASRGHCIAVPVWWDGNGHLGGANAHWVLVAPSGVTCNPWGPQYDHWSPSDLSAHGQSVGIEFLFTEGGFAQHAAATPGGFDTPGVPTSTGGNPTTGDDDMIRSLPIPGAPTGANTFVVSLPASDEVLVIAWDHTSRKFDTITDTLGQLASLEEAFFDEKALIIRGVNRAGDRFRYDDSQTPTWSPA